VARRVRVGIIGLGRSGRDIHGRHLVTVPGKYDLVAVADRLAPRRDRAAREFGCRTYARPDSLLAQDDLDLVVVASPSRQHVSHAIRALRSGHNVLCEKPVARKLSEVEEIERTARRAGRTFAAFHQQRYNPAFVQVRKVIRSGVLGRIVMIRLSANSFSRRWDWQTLRREYGGTLLNTGSHYVDQLLRLLDSDRMPDITCSMDRANTLGDAEDHVKVMMRRRGHPTIDLEISGCCAFPGQHLNIHGTRGGLVADAGEVRWRYFRSREQTRRILTTEPIADAAGLPQYCRDDLKWHEDSWTPSDGSAMAQAVSQYYDMLHRTLTRGRKLEVTMAEVKQQVAVMEECHRQCPPASMGTP